MYLTFTVQSGAVLWLVVQGFLWRLMVSWKLLSTRLFQPGCLCHEVESLYMVLIMFCECVFKMHMLIKASDVCIVVGLGQINMYAGSFCGPSDIWSQGGLHRTVCELPRGNTVVYTSTVTITINIRKKDSLEERNL